MKKSVLALAVLGAFAGVASAQSSVTMFGVVDLNVMSVDNDDRTYSMGTDGMSSSRLGFRGVEDLGGGLKASFWLEMGLAADTGRNAGVWGNGIGLATATSLFFNRRSTVSLSNQWGELRLGRDYTADLLELDGVRSVRHQRCRLGHEPGAGSAIFATALLAGTTYGTLVRANNMVQYILPAGVFGPGLYGQVQVAAGEGARWQQVLGWPHRLCGRSVRRGRCLWPDRRLDVACNVDLDELEHRWFVELRFHEAVGLLQLRSRLTARWQHASARSRELVRRCLGAVRPVELQGQLRRHQRQWTLLDGRSTRRQWAIGADYNLSKRTALYATWSSINNDDGAQFTVSTQVDAASSRWHSNSNGVQLGIRHSF